jgi:hypothetical protein
MTILSSAAGLSKTSATAAHTSRLAAQDKAARIETYVLEGSLVDKEGPAQGIECKAGEFIWREEGSRHVAWCPEGGLMLAIFQVPNKFFEADGRVIDAAGEDWDAAWGHTRKG